MNIVNQFSFATSGNRCIKASHNNHQAEKLTRYIRIFFNFSTFTHRVTIHTSDIKLTANTLMIE
ncbi:MAG: hypothetical protein WCG25_08305 [bacterium]